MFQPPAPPVDFLLKIFRTAFLLLDACPLILRVLGVLYTLSTIEFALDIDFTPFLFRCILCSFYHNKKDTQPDVLFKIYKSRRSYGNFLIQWWKINIPSFISSTLSYYHCFFSPVLQHCFFFIFFRSHINFNPFATWLTNLDLYLP